MHLSNSTILNNVRRQGKSSGGFRNPLTGKQVKTEKLSEPIPATVHKRLENAKIDSEQYEKMLLFAKNANWLRGQRKLKLNAEELRGLVVYPTNDDAPLTDTSGLRSGGLVSLTERKNSSKPLRRKNTEINIKNKNSLPIQANYSAFKNNFQLKSKK